MKMVEEKKSDKEVKKKSKKEVQLQQLKWIIGMMVGLVALFLISNSFFGGFNTFKYEGLVFTKEKFGEIPVFHHYYYFNSPITNQLIKYNLYLRIDPRENEVPVDGEIEFPVSKIVYISIDDGDELAKCNKASVGIAGLSTFLVDNQLNVKGAVPNKTLALDNNIKYATCANKPDDLVIWIKEGKETKIENIGKYCYIINVNNCELIEATEKFEVQSILDSRKRI